MKHLFADTLFKRLFFLMWMALLLSHLAGFMTADAVFGPPFKHGPPPRDMVLRDELPPLPDGPPPMREHGPRPDDASPLGSPGGMPPMRSEWLWLDYLVRTLVIGGAAWLGARWMAEPMRRLARASQAVAVSLAQHRRPPPLDEAAGTVETQQTARVFNHMAVQLHEQFEAGTLMMAAISHDLRTPLQRLRLRLEQLDPGALKERCVADVQEAEHLIASVLDSLRLRHEGRPPQRLDMRALLQSLVDDLSEQGHRVDLLPLPLERPPVVLADASELQRAIGNLVGNALRHAGAAEVTLAEQNGHLLVRVDDRGPGIPEAELEAVFKPFYRVDSSRSRQTGGAGLGLYIARDLVRRHGGELTLANRAEGGLRAELSLPFAS
ncbi:MAG TPA: ATP-binding protein [Rhizobacter sp.]|nr:ATP-binding protein [Rhizobacter sp.]